MKRRCIGTGDVLAKLRGPAIESAAAQTCFISQLETVTAHLDRAAGEIDRLTARAGTADPERLLRASGDSIMSMMRRLARNAWTVFDFPGMTGSRGNRRTAA